MRDYFVDSIIKNLPKEKVIFLTGDLGFMAFEKLKKYLGKNFINCGVAEQNMISVAAGFASSGYVVFAYSIAPFIYLRALEQIKNSFVLTSYPVFLVGNGGGFGYGVMGPTHHSIEDCSIMNSIGINVKVPCFNQDIDYILKNNSKPIYMRLGLDELAGRNLNIRYKSIRKVLSSQNNQFIFCVGPLLGQVIKAVDKVDKKFKPTVFVISEYGFKIPPEIKNYKNKMTIIIYEEHIKEGGFGDYFKTILFENGIKPTHFIHRFIDRKKRETYGSQSFLRKKFRLSEIDIKKDILEN